MKIHITHDFPCTPERFWVMFDDPELEARINGLSKMSREMLSDTTTDDGIRLTHMRLTSAQEMPQAASSVLGFDKLTYEQKSKIDRANNRIEWRVIPPVMAGNCKIGGVYQVNATATGCTRVLDGDIVVKVPFLGAKVEKLVVDLLTKVYDRGAQLMREWLEEHPEG